MGERTQYAPGTFCWADLASTDQPAAKQFYTSLFGWDAEDIPVGDGAVYSMMRVDGKRVAAIGPQGDAQREAGAPSAWGSYVTVESADASAAQAVELGATVVTEPFDVFDVGRMAVIQDPQGAVVRVWEPRSTIGAELVNAPGALVWNELASPDTAASTAFYSALFGWEVAPFEGMDNYSVIRVGEASNGGITAPQAPGAPPHWLVYFGVEDLDASLAQLEELGGANIAGPIDIQIARIAVVSDPQGAVLALYDGQLDP
ncbi:MAG TPA: VOC family protein [Solirubrobacteraceae bacterium]